MIDRYHGFDADLVRSRIAQWPLFDPKLYLRLNADLRGGEAVALDHYAAHGCWEERVFTTQVHLVAGLAGAGTPKLDALAPRNLQLESSLVCRADIGIYASSKSNFFMREIARELAAGLRILGLKVTEGDETTSPDERRPHTVIVAPHEFFLLGEGANWSRADVVSGAVMLSTEQPQTEWFPKSLPYMLSCRGVIELCWQSSEAFAKAGMSSEFYMPGLPTEWALGEGDTTDILQNTLISSLPQAALDFTDIDGRLSERPLNVTFMATASPVREDFLSRHLPALRDLQAILVYRRLGRTVPQAYAEDDQITKVNNFILQRSKILLNIHRDTLGYFEIHRLGMQGIWNRCAVVTNKCFPHPYFHANEHYIEETLERIPKLLTWLIKTPEGRREAERVRGNAIRTYAAAGNSRNQSLRLAEFLARVFGI